MEMCKFLNEHGALSNSANERGETPISILNARKAKGANVDDMLEHMKAHATSQQNPCTAMNVHPEYIVPKAKSACQADSKGHAK